MICSRNPIYLDSEFAHRFEKGKRNPIRVDLVTINDNNQLLFIELKRIEDNRLLNKNDDKPEVLSQMDKYAQFIKTNKDKILEYYKKLYEIKKSMGLPVPECDITKLAIWETPHLMIHNTYCKSGIRRDKRIIRMTKILDKAPFTYEISKHDI